MPVEGEVLMSSTAVAEHISGRAQGAVQYKPGDLLSGSGEEIERVVGQGPHTCVVITRNHQIRWEFPRGSDTPLRLRPAIDTLAKLSSLGRLVYRKHHRDTLRSDLAEALWASFETPAEHHDVLGAFSDVRHRLESRWGRIASVAHCASALLFLLLFLLLLTPAAALIFGKQSYTAAVAGGAIGAFLSVMERTRRLRVDDWTQLWYWSFEGALRVLFGALSGGIMGVVIHLNLFSGSAQWGMDGLFLAGIVGGFVERLVPSLLVRLAQEKQAAANS